MSSPKPALRAWASKSRVALVTALALAATSAALITATAANSTTPDTIWGTGAPAFAVIDPDTNAVELGTRFTAATSGQAIAVRFYKTSANRGQHLGSLWTSTGTLLGRVTFSNETSAGWQSASFTSPVNLTAGTAYVVSYHTSVGRYMATKQFTGTSASRNLQIPSSDVGVYTYGGTSAFPTSTWRASQYWVDLTFSTGKTPSASTTTPGVTPTPTTTQAAPGTTSSTPTTPTTTSATPTVSTSTSASTPAGTPSVTGAATSAKPTNQTTKNSSSSSSSGSTAGGSSSGMTNCVSLPSRCGYPDATNTGVPAGATLRRVPQDITSGPGWAWDSRGFIQASSGAVVQNVIVNGEIIANGSNITITGNQITVGGDTWGVGLTHATNTVVSDNTIGVIGALPRLMEGIKDIYGDSGGTQILRNNIQNADTGVQVYEGVIADNYIHDMGSAPGDHINGTTSNGSTVMMTIRHNTILNKYDQTDAISLFQDFDIEANRLITDNLVAGGGYTIYGGDNQRFGKTYNIKITNNRFSRLYYPNGGYWGPVAAFDQNGVGNVASGNNWDDTLAPVNF
jgi:Domain of unknown function (DUF4082)